MDENKERILFYFSENFLSVLVHRGDVGGGHYYAFFKPNNRWLKFDDKRVSIATEKVRSKKSRGGKKRSRR